MHLKRLFIIAPIVTAIAITRGPIAINTISNTPGGHQRENPLAPYVLASSGPTQSTFKPLLPSSKGSGINHQRPFELYMPPPGLSNDLLLATSNSPCSGDRRILCPAFEDPQEGTGGSTHPDLIRKDTLPGSSESTVEGEQSFSDLWHRCSTLPRKDPSACHTAISAMDIATQHFKASEVRNTIRDGMTEPGDYPSFENERVLDTFSNPWTLLGATFRPEVIMFTGATIVVLLMIMFGFYTVNTTRSGRREQEPRLEIVRHLRGDEWLHGVGAWTLDMENDNEHAGVGEAFDVEREVFLKSQ